MSQVFLIKDVTKISEIFDKAQINKIINNDDFIALKIHFGERGNNAYIKSDRVKPLVKKIKELGGRPFFTDANTLYDGGRKDTLSHLQTAFDHGYTFGKIGAHILIADGLKGKSQTKLNVNYKHFKVLKIGSIVLEADAFISIAHFKGHNVTGFGGAIKNIGMGLGTPAGKLDMHSDCPNCPEVKTCQKKKTIEACWFGSSQSVQEKMTEYTAGILEQFKGKCAFINFLTDISENCDCYDFNSAPIVSDIGILASFDPVAIDQASIDLVNQAAGKDKFRDLYSDVDWSIQLKYAEEIELGSRKYEIINL